MPMKTFRRASFLLPLFCTFVLFALAPPAVASPEFLTRHLTEFDYSLTHTGDPAEFLTLRERDYVAAGRAQGLSDAHLILREVLPNALPPVIVYASVVMAVAILLESALAFLQLSDPNVPSWGNLIGLGRTVLRSEWYVSAIPGVAILLSILGVSLVGQGLNDALNPRLALR